MDVKTWERGRMVAIWVVTAFLLWPVTRFLAAQVGNSEQLSHALIVLAFGFVFLIRQQGIKPEWKLGRRAFSHLAAAYLLMTLAVFWRRPEPVLLAYCCGIAALMFTIFGDGIRRLAYSTLAAFLAFMVLMLIDSKLDWPLRAMAGRLSGWILSVLGQDATLQLAHQQGAQLLLNVNGRYFEVAMECNGFGLLGGAGLLAVLLVLFRPISWFDKILAVTVSLLLALVINSIRIVIITLLAPHVGDHYLLMHEVVGITLFGTGLFMVWWLVKGLPETKAERP